MPFADLHTHSSASDGTHTPAQIAALAAGIDGLQVVSISDHDSLAAFESASLPCAEYGIDLVPGVEVTTRYDGRAVHMLGYFVDPRNRALGAFLDENRRKRADRVCKMADLLHEHGYPICADDLRGMQTTPNRPLLARLLVEHGCVSDVDEAFRKLLGTASPCYVDAVYPDTIEAIRLISEAGGYAFVAHPARYRIVDLIARFSREGMTGVEAYHTLQTPEQSAELVEIAQGLGLGISGGSDWHGDKMRHARLGGCGLDENQYHAFLAACERA